MNTLIQNSGQSFYCWPVRYCKNRFLFIIRQRNPGYYNPRIIPGSTGLGKKSRQIKIGNVVIKPLTPELWPDFEELFGPRGAYGGCWCMYWRITRKEFEACQGEKNRRAFKKIVNSDVITGLLGYIDNRAVDWCSVAPRGQFASLDRSRVLKRIDDKEVWSIVCFFIRKGWRNQGLMLSMIRGTVEYVRRMGGDIIEAYPSVTTNPNAHPATLYMGVPRIYRQAGFREIARPSRSKLVMRYVVDQRKNDGAGRHP